MNDSEQSKTTKTTTTIQADQDTSKLPSPSNTELFYGSGAIAALLLLHAIIAQATRFVLACKKQ